MSNSNLVSYTKISPNSTNPRKTSIKKITIHHMACNGTLIAIGEAFAKPSRQCSSNYGIDSQGKVALYCDEANRAWSSGSSDNDNQAITIEVANDGSAPDWHVSDAALSGLINLCVDICKRNGINGLNYTGDATGNLTMHNYFMATQCPGPYLGGKFKYIASEVNNRLLAPAPVEAPPVKSVINLKPGTWNVRSGANTSTNIITTVSGSQGYEYSRVDNGWYYIDKLQGFIGPAAIVDSPSPTSIVVPPVETAPVKKTITLNPGAWNIRAGTNTTTKVVATVRGSQVYEYSRVDNGWYYIDALKGFIGPGAILVK